MKATNKVNATHSLKRLFSWTYNHNDTGYEGLYNEDIHPDTGGVTGD